MESHITAFLHQENIAVLLNCVSCTEWKHTFYSSIEKYFRTFYSVVVFFRISKKPDMTNRWSMTSMSNRCPKLFWPIKYSSMTSITYWCNWSVIDDPSITHRLLYCARTTPFLLSCTSFFFSCDSFICANVFFLITDVPVDDVETQSANHKYRWFSVVQYFALPNSLFNNETTKQ